MLGMRGPAGVRAPSAPPSQRAARVNSGEVPPSPPPLLLADSFSGLLSLLRERKAAQDAFSDEILGSLQACPSWFQVREVLAPDLLLCPGWLVGLWPGHVQTQIAQPEAGGCWAACHPQQLGGGLGIYVELITK